jgi:DNA segregation ATPase FtsK/SpoIIIE-like protein
MSSTTLSNGTTVLKSFADLASAIDVTSLPPGPAEQTDEEQCTARDEPTDPAIADAGPCTDASRDETDHGPATRTHGLASLIAQLAQVGTGLEAMAAQDARARERATIELAQYEALVAERQEAERTLAEAQRIRAAAEQLAAEAFTQEARSHAAQHAADARAAELACVELLVERTRAAEELAGRPHLARVIAERRRHHEAQAEQERRRSAEREQRLVRGLEAADQALRGQQVDDALAILTPLARDFPDHEQVRRALSTASWQARRKLVAPAEEALREVRSRAGRQDPEWAMTRLAGVGMDGLPEDLARQLFGIWSDLCLTVVRQRGWHDPHRDAPQTSRGVVFARQTPDEAYQVVSVLGRDDWRVGDTVTSLPRTARPLGEPKRSGTPAR